MENDNAKTTPEPGTTAATTPATSSSAPAVSPAPPEQGTASATLPETPPPQPRARTRRERFAENPPVFRPLQTLNASQHETTQPPLPEDSLGVKYSVQIHAGKDIVVDINSALDLPLALRSECLPHTDTTFEELFDKIIVAPVLAQVRAYLQRRFATYAEADAKAKTETPGGNGSHKPLNGDRYNLPAFAATPHSATPPGVKSQLGGRNGQ